MPPSPSPAPSPASSPTSAQLLRRRAGQLRTTASALDAAEALDLYRRAGRDVWLGPTPRRCDDDLVNLRHLLLAAGADLRAEARELEARAAALDATSG
jgi:hypothetical protein